MTVLSTRLQTPLLLIGITAVVLAVGTAGGPTLERVATLSLISVVFVVGLSTFSGNSGVMSFGHVAFMAVGAYTTAYLTIPVPLKGVLFANLPESLRWLAEVHTSASAAVLLSCAMAAVAGLVTAPVVARLSGLQSGIATLAFLLVVYNVLNSWTDVTRGSSSMIGLPRSTTIVTAFVAAALAIAVGWAYRTSRSGLQLQAGREDYWAAQAAGIAVGRHRAIAWVLSATICGLAGSLYASFLTTFNVNAFFLSATFAFVVMIVLGGYLSLSGAVLGAIGVSVLQELLRRLQDGGLTGGSALPPGTANLLLALVLLLTLVKAPYGVMGARELVLVRGGRRLRRGAQAVRTPAGS
ncbi:branched-chain amino acid ABC transporter permease [Nocardioides hwasunensis]|uniref:Branched-chain amino acid ABC transporter permease n=1 Tax=Nocardioides hwasunensis TaxID=397258 RepID=A0ABR8MHL5_9ACTN|nr:branched-chain amino acid ABC transporter permease [Nocardioides hwasunensis]MBD3915568.1 branched-chain amino acid ABC transporter permease [Nocardioides hwasunensis]